MFKIIFSQKNIFLIYNDNIKQKHLSVKKLQLNRKSSSQFAKTLFGILEKNWIFKFNRDLSISLEIASNIYNSNAKQVLKGTSKSNVDKSTFWKLNINQ